jgi:hypothetical protein
MLLTAALGVLGVASGALAARMAELQIVLIPVSLASLALGHYFAYRQGADGRRQRVMLWIATPVSVALWIVPWMLR